MIFYQDDLIQIFNQHCLDLLTAMPDEHVDLILSDPPYKIGYESNKPRKGGQFKQIAGDERTNTTSNLVIPQLYRVLKPDSACYLFTRWDVQEEWNEELRKAGFDVRGELIWDKGGFAMGALEEDWAAVHETVIYAVKGHHKLNGPRPKSIIHAQKVQPTKMVHPNEKPVPVWYAMIRASSRLTDLVLDPYAGSCSCPLACRQLGRRAVGCEIDPANLERVLPRLNQINMFATP